MGKEFSHQIHFEEFVLISSEDSLQYTQRPWNVICTVRNGPFLSGSPIWKHGVEVKVNIHVFERKLNRTLDMSL